MLDAVTKASMWPFIASLAITQIRILAMCAMLPLFTRGTLPGALRTVIALSLGLMAVPVVMRGYATADLSVLSLAIIAIKEAFIGVSMGFLCAIPFWIFEAVGFVVDNQRGAGIGSMLNPASGNESSPLGILFMQAFIVFFMIGGGFHLLLSMLYDSFRLWDVWHWAPTLSPRTVPLILDQFSRMTRLFLVLSAPMVLSMFLAELGLALVSRFVPQLQVFFLAMPIKSGVALLVMILYVGMLFDYGKGLVGTIHMAVPFLDDQWHAS